MTTYAIGSVKGNYRLLVKLLEKIQFDPDNDCLWFTGNLVNEGAESLAVLRFVKDLGKKAVTVLGNQELHLLALAEGFEQPEAGDT
ncbi:MAG: metallophosphoesterase, partial [Methylobacter sp.]